MFNSVVLVCGGWEIVNEDIDEYYYYLDVNQLYNIYDLYGPGPEDNIVYDNCYKLWLDDQSFCGTPEWETLTGIMNVIRYKSYVKTIYLYQLYIG